MIGRAREILPQSIGGIFDEAFDLYRANFGLLAGIAAVCFVPVYGATQWIGYTMGLESLVAGMQPNGSADQQLVSLASLMSILMLQGCLGIVGFAIEYAALTSAVSDRYLARRATIAGAYRTGFRSCGRLLGATILATCLTGICGFGLLYVLLLCVGLASVAGAIVGSIVPILLGVVGVVLGISLILVTCGIACGVGAFIPQIAVLEAGGGANGIGRNWTLARPRIAEITMCVAAATLAPALLQAATASSISLALNSLLFPAIGASALTQTVCLEFVQVATGLLVAPFPAVALTLLYYDQRVRREGFDIAILEEQLASDPRASGG